MNGSVDQLALMALLNSQNSVLVRFWGSHFPPKPFIIAWFWPYGSYCHLSPPHFALVGGIQKTDEDDGLFFASKLI